MNYYLTITFIIAIAAIFYFWYITRNRKYISDTEIIHLDTIDNRLLSDWYKRFSKSSIYFDINTGEVGSRLLKRLYDIDVDPNNIVIGENLVTSYFNITHKSPQFYVDKYIPGSDIFFDIRSCLGLNYELAIIHNSRTKQILQRINYNIDLTDIITIMDSELDIIAKDYLHQILNYRWNKIRQLHDVNVLNDTGTFLYLRDFNVPNIDAFRSDLNADSPTFRVNLLCTDLEFDTLIKRWSSNTPLLFTY